MAMFNSFFVCLLVGGWATPLKNMNVNWDDEIPNIWENTKNGNQTTNQFTIEYPHDFGTLQILQAPAKQPIIQPSFHPATS